MGRRRTQDLTPEEVVTGMHPYNEWSGAHTRGAVAEIGELVRYLNHATQHPEALPDPEAVGEVLRLLGQTVRRLPQVVKQADARLVTFTGSPIEGAADLGARLDALGLEMEKAGFAAKRPS